MGEATRAWSRDCGITLDNSMTGLHPGGLVIGHVALHFPPAHSCPGLCFGDEAFQPLRLGQEPLFLPGAPLLFLRPLLRAAIASFAIEPILTPVLGYFAPQLLLVLLVPTTTGKIDEEPEDDSASAESFLTVTH
jgi:hypothetical protein